MYIWERDDWPRFRWDSDALIDVVAEARYEQGRFLAEMKSAGFAAQEKSELMALSAEILKTSAIEGENLDPDSVRSSIARRLGIEDGGLVPSDRRIDGVVEMMLDVTRNFAEPLTAERLFGWHASLFPTGYSGLHRIDVGTWRSDRDGPMQVVSGSYGRQKIHYEAPPAGRVAREMQVFLDWFEGDGGRMNGILKAGLAHLWFVTVHPLDDGNGRTSRAIADLAIARMEGTGQRFYSMSSSIERERSTYYGILEDAQKGDLDVTEWLSWFADTYRKSVLEAESTARSVMERAKFFAMHASGPGLSERQAKVLRRLFEGFEGKLTAKKYAALAKCSVDTASRDINDLVERGVMLRNPGGSKNTSFSLNLPGHAPEAPEPGAESEEDMAPAPGM